jgi:hypothetical protein
MNSVNVDLSSEDFSTIGPLIRNSGKDIVINRYRIIRQTQRKVIYCYTGQLVSTQLWGHQASD